MIQYFQLKKDMHFWFKKHSFLKQIILNTHTHTEVVKMSKS